MSDQLATDVDGVQRAVRVQAVFHISNEVQAQAVAARMVDRAHEIANFPECECDVDVSIKRVSPRSAPPAAI